MPAQERIVEFETPRSHGEMSDGSTPDVLVTQGSIARSTEHINSLCENLLTYRDGSEYRPEKVKTVQKIFTEEVEGTPEFAAIRRQYELLAFDVLGMSIEEWASSKEKEKHGPAWYRPGSSTSIDSFDRSERVKVFMEEAEDVIETHIETGGRFSNDFNKALVAYAKAARTFRKEARQPTRNNYAMAG